MPEPDPRLRLLDANLLLALALANHVHHGAAHRFLAGIGSWATTPMTETALYRLLLNPVVTGGDFTVGDIDRVARGMRADPRWRFLADDTSLADPTIDTSVLAGHRQVTDLHLVALAARHGACLSTFDARLMPALAPSDRRHVEVVPA